MVKVEGAKNFGIGLGLIVEDALFAVRLDFTIFQVEIECEGSIFLHDDQVTVIDLGCPLTEQHAAEMCIRDRKQRAVGTMRGP